jgi:hypothetical protein
VVAPSARSPPGKYLPRVQREARIGVGIGTPFASVASFTISSALNAQLNTATPPIHRVKPTLRLLWITRPMVKGPPLP